MAARTSEDALVKIAQVVHEAVRAWQKANGQQAAPPWSRAPAWMKQATKEAVAWRIAHPKAPASRQHEQWLAEKVKAGWRRGRTKNGARKTHPLIVPYAQLPEVERRKDALVAAVVDGLTRAMR